MKVQGKTSYLSIIGALYLLLEPILSIYGWTNFSFSKILSLIVVFIYIINRSNYRNIYSFIPKFLLLYFAWLLLCNYFSFGSLLPLGNIFQLLLIISVFTIVKYNDLIGIYRKLAFVCIAFFLVQEISFYITGYRIKGVLEWLPICFGGEGFDLDHYLSYQEVGDRSSSFFSEPAHFAQFLLPLFAIEIFNIRNLRSTITPLVLIVILLLLRSGNGLIGLTTICFLYSLSIFSRSSFTKKLVASIFVIIFSGSIYYYAQSEMGNSLLERSESVSGEVDTSSGFIRTFRGYYIYDEYNLFEKLIGINNIETIKKKRDQCKVSWTFASDNDVYVNCIQDVLLRTGIIGAAFFVLMLLSIWKQNKPEGKAIVITFFILSFFASLYMSSTMMLYLYLAYNIKLKRKIGILYNNVSLN